MAASESNLFARASKVVYIASLNKYFWTRVEDVGGKWVLFKGLFTRNRNAAPVIGLGYKKDKGGLRGIRF